MSRIDEALKRVAADSAPEPRTGVGAVVRALRPPSDNALDNYPEERPRILDAGPIAGVQDQSARNVGRSSAGSALAKVEAFGPVDAAFEGKLVAGEAAETVSIEQYRRLAATLHELQLERDLKTLMVTSALPREGKTLTITNLAFTLSGSCQRRVLLIDADLRRPSVHDVLNLPNTAGLKEALQSDRAELPVRQVSPLFAVLTAGRPDNNPMALLTSERMQRLLDESAARFDWVLLDAPPVGFMPDAGLLAGMTHGVLFVIAAGSTPYHLVQRATNELGIERIVGTVLNRVEDENIPATGYYRDYYASKSEG